jgi:hypothetical protein
MAPAPVTAGPVTGFPCGPGERPAAAVHERLTWLTYARQANALALRQRPSGTGHAAPAGALSPA